MAGDESVSLEISDNTVGTWIASTSMQGYTVNRRTVCCIHEQAGQRAFNLLVEDQSVVNAIDLYSEVGHDKANTISVDNVHVVNGELTISLKMLIDNGTIAGFAVYSPDGALGDIDIEPTGVFVGNITTRSQVRSDFTHCWDQITPKNEGKWGSVEHNRDQYNWAPLDRIYEYARANNIPVKAHILVWGSQCPSWIGENCSGSALSASELRAEIEEWIRDDCTRYPDMQFIDGVNEATPGHAAAGYAKKAFGNNWIIRSFELAAQYCPNFKQLQRP
ncbi:endo-1,4-beta-xylanase [Gynuella sunshinyii]|uniref:endo-1,4-beta-xylanase n=1 Tax=Gynuella sunshinyii YC6258 TaxID=1445510 RepID=A0A0C5V886_9GAMM|nr:endo-1,4-beta-xylanase [Gynuella sunshinyii]AJQ95610.1 beta-1,4-xylanase [Gynuella sunshinyii YC6258]